MYWYSSMNYIAILRKLETEQCHGLEDQNESKFQPMATSDPCVLHVSIDFTDIFSVRPHAAANIDT